MKNKKNFDDLVDDAIERNDGNWNFGRSELKVFAKEIIREVTPPELSEKCGLSVAYKAGWNHCIGDLRRWAIILFYEEKKMTAINDLEENLSGYCGDIKRFVREGDYRSARMLLTAFKKYVSEVEKKSKVKL